MSTVLTLFPLPRKGWLSPTLNPTLLVQPQWNGGLFPEIPQAEQEQTPLRGSILTSNLAAAPFTGGTNYELIDEDIGWDFNLFGEDSNLEMLNSLLYDSPRPSMETSNLTVSVEDPCACLATPCTLSQPGSDAVQNSSPSTDSITLPTSRTSTMLSRPSKRNISQVDVSCRVCSIPLGQCHLYGDIEHVQRFVPDFACVQCAHGTAWNDKKTHKKLMSKKRHADFASRDAPVPCDVCKNVCAAGGFRRATSTDEWCAPDFAVEVNCAKCREKYPLCSDCGGGGKFRTGKWRPVQMLAPLTLWVMSE
ncbi:hypothetical protein DFJ77DRAFT_15509 [Powellomyces hirtus]|nr:hypothetical protein DFJ77DRAFT_15509 [Powellomyces hirtus]